MQLQQSRLISCLSLVNHTRVNSPDALHTSNLSSLPRIYSGKVRDVYAVGEDHLLIVATDRISAYDVILPGVIPGKGKLLTELALFWFDRMKSMVPNHLSDLSIDDVVDNEDERQLLRGRSMVVKKLEPLAIEAVVRGYLIGSGWRDYEKTGAVCGIELPAGLSIAEKLSEDIFTPATKAAVGDHDENISYDQAVAIVGADHAKAIRELSFAIYREAHDFARERGIIIADTKFEFGLDANGTLTLMDEILTPDSSRFWPAGQWQPGTNPSSFDKQFVRDYLETLDWDKTPPGPELPGEVVDETLMRYRKAIELLTASK